MKNIHCNIVRDLLPSYVDEITSEESNEIIKQHLKECASCKETYDTLKSNAFISDKTDYRMAHFFERKRQEKLIENGILLFMVLFLSLLQFYGNYIGYGDIQPPLLYIINCILYPTYNILLATVLSAWKKQSSCPGKKRLALWGEGLGILYVTVLFYYILITISNGGDLPFGLALNQTGPFLVNQLHLLAVVCILILLAHIISQRPSKTYHFHMVMMSLAGVTIALNARAILHCLDDNSISAIKPFTATLVAIIAETILLKIFYQKVWGKLGL